MMRTLALAALTVASLTITGHADDRDDRFNDRPGVGVPVRFLAENGGAFRPDRLVIAAPDGTVSAALPASVNSARSEDRIDLSQTPLFGVFFQDRLAPGDAASGTPVGPVYRNRVSAREILYLESTDALNALTERRLILTSRLPRDGTVSFRFQPLSYQKAAPMRGRGPQIGVAYLRDGALVIASNAGGEPPSLRELFRF